MKLTLSVISFAGADVNRSEKITVNQEGATLGRNEDNTLVLSDPKHIVSKHHAIIKFLSPFYYLEDTSTNGVFINDSKMPLGNGNSIKLNDGDRLAMGDYIIEVRIEGDFFGANSQAAPPLSDDQFNFSGDPFAEPNPDPLQGMIDKNDLIPPDWKSFMEKSNDPYEFLDNPIPKKIPNEKIDFSQGNYDHIPAYKEAFSDIKVEKKELNNIAQAPNVSGDIFSENWYSGSESQNDEIESTAAADNKDQFQPEIKPAINESFQVHTEDPIHTIPSSEKILTSNALAEELIQNFLRGAQLEQDKFRGSINPETFFIVGTFLRAAIQGARAVLIGRAKIKNEMHLDVTTIRSKQNNPIKFSDSPDEVLSKLLLHKGAGSMPPKEAIEEAFDDILAHQYSVIAGMRSALLTVLKRFDPQKLEERLQKLSPISASIPIHKQAKLWDLFVELYEEIEQEAEDNFYHLFGQAFAETYEQQMQKLKSSKKDIF